CLRLLFCLLLLLRPRLLGHRYSQAPLVSVPRRLWFDVAPNQKIDEAERTGERKQGDPTDEDDPIRPALSELRPIHALKKWNEVAQSQPDGYGDDCQIQNGAHL